MDKQTIIEFSEEDVEAIAVHLGVPRMQQQIANMAEMLNQLLAYVNTVDDRIAELNGEPRLTRHVKPNFNPDTGNVDFDIEYPGVPKDIKPPTFLAQEQAKKSGVKALIRDGR